MKVDFSDLSRADRDLIEDKVIEDIGIQDPCGEELELEGTVHQGNYIVDYEYTSWIDEEEEVVENSIKYDIEKLEIDELFKLANVKFEKSNTSPSIYFTFKGEKYRISDHDKPLTSDGYDWAMEYDKHIVCSGEVEIYKKVKEILNV